MLLTTQYQIVPGIDAPAYTPKMHGTGIVHFGVGAFHRSHQAVYTDTALALHGGDWRITGVSLQSTAIADAINQQDGLYTLLTRSPDDSSVTVRIIGSIKRVEAASRSVVEIQAALASENTKIVSMTVTEKAYGIDRSTGHIDKSNSVIAHDLSNPDDPRGVIGFIVKGLALRKENGLSPFTVLCCDNLPNNGQLIRSAVLDFAGQISQSLAEWIATEAAFPSTMVDRITPATTAELITEVGSRLLVQDNACVEAEQFSQWVIEDNFCCGRPQWQDAGAIFVDDVTPYEKMKLRMLNGTHSLIAYLGFLCGHRFVRDVMASPSLRLLVESHIRCAARTLPILKNIDTADYGQDLIQRFTNVNIAHETYQIAMDGSQKMPQRIFEPALESLQLNLPIESYAITTAAWIRYCAGIDVEGKKYDIRDPAQAELSAVFSRETGAERQLEPQLEPQRAESVCKAVFSIPGIVPAELAQSEWWLSRTSLYLDLMLNDDMQSALTIVNRELKTID